RIDAGDPGPVSVRRPYNNYILASDQTILKQYSGDIAGFDASGLLPRINAGIRDFYLADKVYFVGLNTNDPAAWQAALGHLNAGLGAELQSDAHLVIVQNEKVSANPDAYALALKAYWQNTKVFGKDALSKNGIVVVLGIVDGETVSWARAFTGMPLGNEELAIALRNNLKGVPLSPEAVIGSVNGQFYPTGGENVRSIHGNGVIEAALWGLIDPQTKFRRYGMSGKNKNAAGAGFLYLKGEIQPTARQKFWIFFCAFLISGISWVACAFIGERTYKSNRRYY
ncbi:MAG: hypothetical protein Q8P49_02785, partial [Candidatus Liptonbacteria bacterium]|nr:hypothetical protein [Candidatus Liptonbacteria bacterium]